MVEKWLWVEVLKPGSIEKVESAMGIKLPEDYIQYVQKYNGGFPKPGAYYAGNNIESINNLLSLNNEDTGNIFEYYDSFKERADKGLYPFARDAGDNLICFDYRSLHGPTIVFWDHEKAFFDGDRAIKPIASSFTEFLEELFDEDEEDEE